MKKTIKIIDLLNKIANSEEVPKRIKYCGDIYEYNDEFYYMNGYSLYRDFYTEGNCLNYEVEIIEEDNKIGKIEMYEDEEGHYFLNNRNKKIYINCDEIDFIVNKLNELIEEIEKLNGKSE